MMIDDCPTPTPLLTPPPFHLRSRNAAAGVAGITTFVRTTVCTDVGKRLHTLPSHPASGERERFN